MVVMFMRMMVTMKMALKSKVSTGGMILPHPGRARPWADFADSSSGGSNNCSALQ